MAAIEKICEFSGQYPSYSMYDYKNNHIQIMPEYRKKFRGAKHELHIFPEGMIVVKNGFSYYSIYNPDDMNNWIPSFSNEKEYIQFLKSEKKERVIQQYAYVLKVFDPNLQGNVNGEYLNFTCSLPTMKRKLKRMLRCKKLNIVNHDITIQEYRS